MQVYDVEIDDDEVLMWWEEFEHGNPALKGKSNVQIGDFFLLHEHCKPCTNHFLCFFNYGPPLDNQNMWQLISFDPSLDNSFSHLLITHVFHCFFLLFVLVMCLLHYTA